MEEWSEDLLTSIENKILDDKFTLSNLNYTHYFFFDPDNYEGSIISTSIRIYPNSGELIKRVLTRYIDSNMNEKEISYEREIDKNVISNIEKNADLRKLSNNYASDSNIGDEESFELKYNNIYKIVGTLDTKIPEVEYIKTILTVNDILEDEKKKVSDLL